MVIPFNIRYIDAKLDNFSVGLEISSTNHCGAFLCERGNIRLRGLDDTIELREGSVFFYTSTNFVMISDISDDAKGILAEFEIEAFIGAIRRVIDVPSMIHIRRYPTAILDHSDFIGFISELKKFRDDISGHEITSKSTLLDRINYQILMSRGSELTFRLLHAYFKQNPIKTEDTNRADRIYEEFMRALYRHFSEHRDVAFYADLQHLSQRHFSTVIKSISGVAPSDIIENLVTTEAKRLLSGGILSIKEVTAMLNFPSQSFFGKYFKRNTGISPTQYRKQAEEQRR